MNRQSYPRKAKCAHCRTQYLKKSMGHVACSPDCAIQFAVAKREKADQKATKAKLLEFKPISYWQKRTERACNAYILVRDAQEPCISCRTWDTVQWEAGHYHNVGAKASIRYDESNIHKQCHRCNFDLAGNKTEYGKHLVRKVGAAEVERLDCAPIGHKWTRTELQGLEAHYKAKTAELRRLAA